MGKPRDLANLISTGNPLADGAIAVSEISDLTATAAELNIMDGVTATTAELNIMDGVTATTAELNHVDGVTSNVQTQMDTKAPTADPTFTGTLAAPTINASTKLQVDGTDVITNARALSNITSIDATTAAAIGAGGVGGGGSIELTASGSITAGDLVGITPSGGVSKLKTKSTKNTIETSISNRTYIGSKYLGSNKIIVLYMTASNTLVARVGTISGTSISFGSSQQVNSDAGTGTGVAYVDVVYDSNTGNVVFFWSVGSDSDKAYLRAASISGTTLTFGSSVNVASNSAIFNGFLGWDPDTQRGLAVYSISTTFKYSLFSLGGTGSRTITLEQDNQGISGDPRLDGGKMAYDTTADKMVIVFRNASTNALKYICADIGSSSVTFGSEVSNGTAGATFNFSVAFIPTLNKVGFLYKSASNILKTGFVTLSGTTVTLNETTLLDHGNVNDYIAPSISAEPDGTVLILYGDTDASLTDKVRGIIGSFSGTNFVSSLSDFTLIMEDSNGNEQRAAEYEFYYTDSTNDKFILMCYVDTAGAADSVNGYFAYTIPSTDDIIAYDNWIGIASQSVSDGASVDVTVQGGLNENQSSLDVGRKYYLQDDATISTTFKDDRLIGISTAATKLFLTNGSIIIGPTGFNSN